MNTRYIKKIGVYGLGDTGTNVLEFLATIKAQKELYAWDDNQQHLQSYIHKYTHIIFTNEYELWRELDFIIVSPGISQKHPTQHKIYSIALQHRIPILSDIDLFVQAHESSFLIAVTGTNGKSTITSLIEYILYESINLVVSAGNIGKAVLSPEVMYRNSAYYVLELSSFQLETLSHITFFDIGIILNITADHTDRYFLFHDYYKAKHKLLRHIRKVLIIYVDSPCNLKFFLNLQNSIIKKRIQIIPLSNQYILTTGISLINKKFYLNRIGDYMYRQSFFNTTLYEEALLVIYALFRYFQFIDFFYYLQYFSGLKHRFEIIYQNMTVIAINDSKATNTAATIYALQNLQTIHWISGGVYKEKSLSSLKKYTSNIVDCYFIGRDSSKFIDFAKNHQLTYYSCKSLRESLCVIRERVHSGTILLSPSCSSFDYWDSYSARGKDFKKIIKYLFFNDVM